MLRFLAAIALFVTPAMADEKTVTLTQAELTAVVNAQVSKMMGQIAADQAKGAYEKIQKAFELPQQAAPADTSAIPPRPRLPEPKK